MTQEQEQVFVKQCFQKLIDKGTIKASDLKKSTVTEKEIEELEEEYQIKLPSLFRTYLMTYSYEFTRLLGVVLCNYGELNEQWIEILNIPEKAPMSGLKNYLDGIRGVGEELFGNKETFLSKGYIPFGDWGAAWGPVCFNTNSKANSENEEDESTWSIVWFDHEEWFDGNEIDDLAIPAAPGFKDILEWYFCGKYQEEYDRKEEDCGIAVNQEVKELLETIDFSDENAIPDTSDFYKKLDEWWEKDKFDCTIEFVQKIPKSMWSDKLLVELICAYNNKKEFDFSRKLLEEYKAQLNKSVKWYYLYAYTYYVENNYEQAITLLKEGLNLDSEHESSLDLLKECELEAEKEHKKRERKKAEEKRVKFVYSKEEQEFKVVDGCVDLGYLGVYTYDQMGIDFDWEYYKEEFWDKEDSWYAKYEPIRNYLSRDMSHEQVAEGIEEYYNQRLQNIKEHQTEINHNFLVEIFDDLCGCGYPFWEDGNDLASFIIEENMPTDSDLEKAVYTKEANLAISQALYVYRESANNGVKEKINMEELIKMYFPMIDMKKFVSEIEAEYLNFDGVNISFQCNSRVCDNGIICSAYAEILPDNSFYDWHNH